MPAEMDPLVVRLLTLAGLAPGAVIVASGEDAASWSIIAGKLAPACRIDIIEQGPQIAQALADSAVRHLFVLRHSGKNFAETLGRLDAMLAYSRIDVILFDGIDQRAELPSIAGRLVGHGYRLYGGRTDGSITEFTLWLHGRDCVWYLAIHQRVADLLLFSLNRKLDLAGLCQRFGIEIRGLLHLGAHEGQELAEYRGIGSFPITFVEAHPDIYQRLVANIGQAPDVFAIHAAVAERDGPVTLHLSADDESSSVLPIGALGRLIPAAIEQGTMEVPGRTLDSLVAEWRSENHRAAGANVMVCDIQGAELLALQGARETLPQFDAVILELSFDDLYVGCGQVEEVDQFMSAAGFSRMATISTWHPGWSDAFYVRRR